METTDIPKVWDSFPGVFTSGGSSRFTVTKMLTVENPATPAIRYVLASMCGAHYTRVTQNTTVDPVTGSPRCYLLAHNPLPCYATVRTTMKQHVLHQVTRLHRPPCSRMMSCSLQSAEAPRVVHERGPFYGVEYRRVYTGTLPRPISEVEFRKGFIVECPY